MATKKGLCPYCTPKRVERRIFPVNPGASTCYCPLCMKEIEPKEAIAGYRALIDKMLSKADHSLFVTCDPVRAYSEYAEVIELEAKEAHALLGRILCLIYMGKVRKSYLSEASTLLENTSYDGCNLDDFVFFLKKINFALDEYESVVIKRLTFRKYFYDLDCLKLYLEHLSSIVKIKEYILSLAKGIKKIHYSNQIDVLINMLEHNVADSKETLRSDSFTADGKCYKLIKFINGKASVRSVDKKVDSKLYRYRLSTLDANDKHKKYIRDEIFKDYTRVAKAEKAFLAISLFFYLIMGGAIAATFIFFKNQPLYFYSLIAAAGLAFAIATTLFIFHLKWRITLKKRKLRID